MSNVITRNRIRAYLESDAYAPASRADEMALDALNFYGIAVTNKAAKAWYDAILDLIDEGAIVFRDEPDVDRYSRAETEQKVSSVATPLRAVRISENIWTAAKERAAINGESLSDVIRRSLSEYGKR